MKKIYALTLAGIALFGTISAQQNSFERNTSKNKAVLSNETKSFISSRKNAANAVNAKTTASPSFTLYVEPIGDIMTQKNVNLDGSASAEQDVFIATVHMDSTAFIEDRPVYYNMLGTTLDPKSTLLQASFAQIVDATEAYTLDSVFILGSYVQVNPAVVDTLYTWIVWADTSNKVVYKKFTSTNLWSPPLSDWKPTYMGPTVSGATATAGNPIKPGAPVTNKMLVKYVLQPGDVASGGGFSKYIGIGFTPIIIPANNVVSCFFTFVPGEVYASGDVVYTFDEATYPQTRNGFGALVWGQTNPVVAAASDYVNHQVDLDGNNGGITYDKYQRHRYYNATYRNTLFEDPTTAPLITYRITGPSGTVGVAELEKTVATLGQNTPNPFTKESAVKFNLAKEAKSAVFTVTDVMGRVILSEKVGTTMGNHSIKLGAYAAGLYYYSLNVDGNVTTKKMIVE